MKLDKKMQGFSLIELLVVVAIIGILAAVGTVGYSNYMNTTKSRVTAANADAVLSGLKTKAAAANTGAGCTTWSTCLTEVTNDIKKNPYDNANYGDTTLLQQLTDVTAPTTDNVATTVALVNTTGATPQLAICGTTATTTTPVLKIGQIGYLRTGTRVAIYYCAQNTTTTANGDVIRLPDFDFGQ